MTDTKRSIEEQAVLLLVNGMPESEVERVCQTQGASAAKAKAAVAAARKRITIAAEYDRTEQLGMAVKRLEDLYGRAVRAGAVGTALQAQKELSRLLDLYAGPPVDAAAPGEGLATLGLIAAHLKPLGLAEADCPVEEHARLAAEWIRSNQAEKVEEKT